MTGISLSITIITLNVNGFIILSKGRNFIFQTESEKHVFWIQFCTVYMRYILDLKIQKGAKRNTKDQDTSYK